MNAEKRELYRVIRDGLEAAKKVPKYNSFAWLRKEKKIEGAKNALRTLESMEPPNG